MTRENWSDDFDAVATLEAEFPSVRYLGIRRRVLIAAALLFFVSGTICGAAGMRLANEYRPTPGPTTYLESIGARIQREHGINDATRAQVEGIVKDHQPRLHAIRLHSIAPMREELMQMIDRIAAALPAKEAERYRTGAIGRLDRAYPSETETQSSSTGSPAGQTSN